MNVVTVDLGERRYDVVVGAFGPSELVERVRACVGGASSVAALVDAGLAEVSGDARALLRGLAELGLPFAERRVPAGEPSKTWSELGRTLEWMAGERFDRRTVVVALGGGATGDHAGLASALFMRGVSLVLVPTTLLAMVDASVGGKTAVNLDAGKNLAGAFHQPRGVVADVGFLDTLPPRHIRAGLAEACKCSLLGASAVTEALEHIDGQRAGPPTDRTHLAALVAACADFKAKVVAEDEREAGRRAILNFGHTLGHALEAASGYGLLHGEAVALGMMAALHLGRRLGVTPAAVVDRGLALLRRCDLPVDFAGRIDDDVLARLAVDKKRVAGRVRFVLLRDVGQVEGAWVAIDQLRGLRAAPEGPA